MFSKEGEKYFPKIYWKVDEKQCIFSKRCEKEERFVPNGDLYKDCMKRIEESRKDIPQGSYYIQTVRPNKKGELQLYVVIDNNVVKIATTLTEINQNYIYIQDNLDGYSVSLTPFEIQTKGRKNVKK